MFCPNGVKPGTDERKDSLVNAETTGEFVYNMCTTELGEAMVRTAVHEPASIDEMAMKQKLKEIGKIEGASSGASA